MKTFCTFIFFYCLLFLGLIPNSIAQNNFPHPEITLGARSDEIFVTIRNPAQACGLKVSFPDGRVERKLLKPGEVWRISHSFNTRISRNSGTSFHILEFSGEDMGGRLFGDDACPYDDKVVVISADGKIYPVAMGVAWDWIAPEYLRRQGKPFAKQPPAAPEGGLFHDFIVFGSSRSNKGAGKGINFVQALDGRLKVANPDDLKRHKPSVCILKIDEMFDPTAWSHLAAAVRIESEKLLSALADGLPIQLTALSDCSKYSDYPFPVILGDPDLIAIQRAAIPYYYFSSNAVFATYRVVGEIPQGQIFSSQASARRIAENDQQKAAQATFDFERLVASGSREKVASLDFDRPPRVGPRRFCTIRYDEDRLSALAGFAHRDGTTPPSKRRTSEGDRPLSGGERVFERVFADVDAIYSAEQLGRNPCETYVDYPSNIGLLAKALESSKIKFAIGELAETGLMREIYAKQQGFASYPELLNGREMQFDGQQMRRLASFGVLNKSMYDRTVAESRETGYGAGSDIKSVLLYLQDKADAARKPGGTAIAAREDREKAERERALAARRALEERAREFPFYAVLTCGFEGRHINILACFTSETGRLDTDIKLRNGSAISILKPYDMHRAGRERPDGFYIELKNVFDITAQNASSDLVLGLSIVDRMSDKVLFQSKAGRFGVVSARN